MRRGVLKGCLSIGSALLVPGCGGIGTGLSGSSEPDPVGSCTKVTENVDGSPPLISLTNTAEKQYDVTLRLVPRNGRNAGELFCERTFTLRAVSHENGRSVVVRPSIGGIYEFTVTLASGESLRFDELVSSRQSVGIVIDEDSTLTRSNIIEGGKSADAS